MAASAPGPMSQLLARVQKNTQVYLDFFAQSSLPEPSFEDGDGLDPREQLPYEIQAARDAALEATDELHHLLLGPMSLLAGIAGDQFLLLAVQYIYRHNIAKLVPPTGTISFDQLAGLAKIIPTDVERFLRVAMARHVFREPRKGLVQHTAASRFLTDNTLLENWITINAEEFWPSLARTVDATSKWPASEEPNQSGYSLAHNTEGNPFDIIKRDQARQERFNDAMTFSHLRSTYSVDHLLSSYDFSRARKIVDVGGMQGLDSIAIAERYPDVQCVVQDIPEVISGLATTVPANLQDRVVGMEHDFFAPQPVDDADVYLLRWILHDWSDKYAIEILKNLVTALKRGARVVINDICIPEPGQLGIAAERALRLMDISLKAFNNARERDYNTWVSLFKEADSRYEFLSVKVPPGARMAVIEAQWSG